MDRRKSEQIRVGLRKSFESGSSAKASTVCYGYKVASTGELLAYPAEAVIVFHIFERFVAGDSLGKIAASLARLGVPSPTGKPTWSRETISKLLDNEKYVGDVILGKTQVQDGVQVKTSAPSTMTVMTGHHEAIISRELFDMVQREKRRRGRARSHAAER